VGHEDYSEDGDAWSYFSHDQSRSSTYHWGEGGLAGISDDKQQLCFAMAFWNGVDPILKERRFGLKWLYKYPQKAYPYDNLVKTSRQRGRLDFEYELVDTGVFDDDRYWDIQVEYAKAPPEDVLIHRCAADAVVSQHMDVVAGARHTAAVRRGFGVQ
jgi:hypothetical protein